MVLGFYCVQDSLPFFMHLRTTAPLWGEWCCALCLGVIDWHNCGIILGAVESSWGLVCTITLTLCIIRGNGAPLMLFVMGPQPGNVTRNISLFCLWLCNIFFGAFMSPLLSLHKVLDSATLFNGAATIQMDCSRHNETFEVCDEWSFQLVIFV